MLLSQLAAIILVGLDYFPNVRRWIYYWLKSFVGSSAKLYKKCSLRDRDSLVKVLNKGGILFFMFLFMFISTRSICEHSFITEDLKIAILKISFFSSAASFVCIMAIIIQLYSFFWSVICRAFLVTAEIFLACHKVRTLSVLGFFIHALTIVFQYIHVAVKE